MSSIFSLLAISRTGTSFPSVLLSVLFVSRHDKALVSCCMTSSQGTTSKSNSDGRSRYSATVLAAFSEFNIYRHESWSVRMVNRVSSSYGSWGVQIKRKLNTLAEWYRRFVPPLLMSATNSDLVLLWCRAGLATVLSGSAYCLRLSPTWNVLQGMAELALMEKLVFFVESSLLEIYIIAMN